jgi:hypothetical protein
MSTVSPVTGGNRGIGPEVLPGDHDAPRGRQTMIMGGFGRYWGCCRFRFPGFLVLLLAELVYGTPVQAG